MKSNTGIISGCSESTDSNTSSGIWLHQYSVLMSVLSVYDFVEDFAARIGQKRKTRLRQQNIMLMKYDN